MGLRVIGTTKRDSLPVYEAECIKCGKKFGVVHTPIMEGRTIPCPRCRLWHVIRFEENVSLGLEAIVPYVYKE